MPGESNRFFVLTGGPGSGKTTLIDALRAAGFATASEAGRGIIRGQLAISGPALPWNDPALFAERMFLQDMDSYDAATRLPGPVFFDRGAPDTLGYLRLTGLPAPDHMKDAIKRIRYNRRIFIAPPWPEIFIQDAERKQDFDEARRTHDTMALIYTELGYELVSLPCVPVDERLRFILAEAGIARR